MRTYGFAVRCAALALALVLPVSGYALLKTRPPMDMQQLTKAADEIVVGTVLTEKTIIVGKRFETNYTVQVSDTLKSGTGSLAPGRQFTMTLPGGSLTTPPLTQYATGVPYMVKGEDVVLFLRQPTGAKAPTRAIDPRMQGNLQSSYSIVGWNEGRFSIFTDKDTGEKLVTRVNLEDFGLMNTSKDTQMLLQALKDKKLPTVRRALLNEKGSASATREKDPLELTGVDQTKLTVEQRQTQAQTILQQRQRKGIPAQTYDSFVEQVRRAANQ
jgi:hypothetical protein